TVTEGLVEQTHRTVVEQRTAACSRCGQTLSARGPQERTVETLVGAIRLWRPYFDCEPRRLGSAPLDAALELAERRKQPDVQKAAVALTKQIPYETACELFEQLTGMPLSVHTAHEVTYAVATGLTVLEGAPTQEAIVAKIAAVAAGQAWRPILVLAIDGAEVPTRPETATGRRPGRTQARAERARGTGAWRAAKGFRFYLLADGRIVQVLSWHQVQTDEEVAEALRQVHAAGLIPEEQVRLCVIADGARWIWKQAQVLFPSAVELLDYYHCREHLHKVAVLPYGAHPARQQAWYEAAVARLSWGEVHGVIWGLQRMKPTDAQAAEEIAKLMSYLQRYQERLDYRFARKGGYPIGSGGIESANKFICHVRLKRSGAWWYVTNANQMLALRCANYNGTFDRVFDRSRQSIQADSKQQCPKK
ncbi:MAG TPA: ISKra4 family transposase, partial [Candidatus Tectomicrobia bacterium]